MSKRNSAPTIGWVFSSHMYKYIALASGLIVLLLAFYVSNIHYAIKRDCANYYKADFEPLGHWVHIEVGSTKPECPQYDAL